MSVWKVHEYIDETKRFFLPMCSYGRKHYPELLPTIELLQDKIISLTQASVILVDRYDTRERQLQQELQQLQEENARLKSIFDRLWKE